jgi:hypothetical protein
MRNVSRPDRHQEQEHEAYADRKTPHGQSFGSVSRAPCPFCPGPGPLDDSLLVMMVPGSAGDHPHGHKRALGDREKVAELMTDKLTWPAAGFPPTI